MGLYMKWGDGLHDYGVVYLIIRNVGVISLNKTTHAFVEISKHIQIRENNLMNGTYISPNFSNFQHFAELISSIPLLTTHLHTLFHSVFWSILRETLDIILFH